jgi:hypothetical protein
LHLYLPAGASGRVQDAALDGDVPGEEALERADEAVRDGREPRRGDADDD